MTGRAALLDVRTRADWRAWLQAHHASESAIWVVFDKRHTGIACLAYDDAVEEALCFGWVDSLIASVSLGKSTAPNRQPPDPV